MLGYNSGMKKPGIIESVVAWLLLFIFALIIVHAPLIVYVGSHFPPLAVAVKTWKEVLMVLALVLMTIEVSRKHKWQVFTRDKLFWVIMAYVVLHFVALTWTRTGMAAVWAGLAIDLRYILYLGLVYAFLTLYPHWKQSFKKIAIMGAIVVIGFACLEILLPRDALRALGYGHATIEPYLTVDKNPAFVRYNSTLRGPNPLGAYAAGVVAVFTAFLLPRWKKLSAKQRWGYAAAGVASLVALYVSYSRSAYLGAAAGVATALAVYYGRGLTRWLHGWRVRVLVVAVLVLGIVGYSARNTNFVQNVVIHNNPTTGAAIDSNTGHLTSLEKGMAQVVHEPLGAGVGSSGSASLFTAAPTIIENQYLVIAHESGWLGIALFATLFVMLLARLWAGRRNWFVLGVLASGIGLALIGFVLPVWADDTVSIVWWGLAGVALAEGAKRGTANKKAA